MIGVINYGMGNLRSVLNALEHCGADAELVGSPAEAERAEKLVLPGVGAFGVGMESLDHLGFTEALPRLTAAGRPLLGICLGMQLLAERGHEHGDHAGLGLVPGEVTRIEANGLRIPHVGWNSLAIRRPSPLLENLSPEPTFYFVHSFAFATADPAARTAGVEYGEELTACVEAGNVYGVQFHPEKSQADGLQLLRNFIVL